MGETRVNLAHLLADLRDAYPGSVEETIVTEMVANALDSGARCIGLSTNPVAGTVTVTDDGEGMSRAVMSRYHDLASTSKRRGRTIGFAGVGIKLGLLISDEVVTESRNKRSHPRPPGGSRRRTGRHGVGSTHKGSSTTAAGATTRARSLVPRCDST